MNSHATLRYARISPRKARLVADMVRGKDASEAVEILEFVERKTAPLLKKLLESAIANAEHRGGDLDIDTLYVESILVDGGPTLRRFRPRAQGRATKVMKKTSHITVRLATRQ